MRWAMIGLLIGCNGGRSTGTTPAGSPTGGTPPTVDGCVLTEVQPEVIDLFTRDGVRLEADRYPGLAGRPGIALFHMIPPSNTRADYPASFIRRLSCHGWAVVNVDRRGAGGSEGTPVDSYEGPGGAYDVEAAVQALSEIGAEGLGLVGASNGTTSALDYAVLARAEGLPEPTAIAMLTGGTYTENQNPLSAAPSTVDFGLFYSDLEATWSEAQRPLDPGSWRFEVYPDGGHGTQLFTTDGKRVKDDLESFFVDRLAAD